MATVASDSLYFDLGLSPSANNVIQSVAQRRHISPSEVLARAIALIKIEEDAHAEGNTLGVIGADNQVIGELA